MADELNTPTHRWHQPRNNIKLPNTDFSRDTIFDSGIQKIDAWINSQPWGNPIPALFAASEPGVWYDPSDITTLFQDSAGTTPVTAAGQPVGRMLDKSGRNNHALQATAGSRPLYQIDGAGKPYLQFDGVDDSLDATTVNLVGAPYVAAVVGQRKERDTTIGTILSHGVTTSTAGFWQVFAPRSGTNYGWRGFDAANAPQDANGGAFPQPDLAVVSGLFDPAAASGVQITGRRNGSVVIQGGTGLAPFISTSLSVGKRGPTGDLPYLGRVYGVFVRGAATTADQLVAVENWLNTKTGAY